MAIKSIKLNSNIHRILLIAAIILCLIVVFFFAKWAFANSISSRADLKEIAEFTVGLAPSDPQTHYALAVLNERSFQPEDMATSLKEFETATALSPNDFRLWLAFGNARGQNGDAKGAEAALRYALKLAPNYANIHWALGNNLVRQGKTEEGFAEIRLAAQSNPKFIKPMISTAFLILDGDMKQIKKYIGDLSPTNAQLALFLAEQEKLDEALEIWNSLPAEEKNTTYKEIGEQLFRKTIAQKKFRDAFLINKQIGEESVAKDFTFEKIYNGGFEADVKPKEAGVFEWKLGNGVKPQIVFDNSNKNGGSRSLLMLFDSTNGKAFRTISQIVPVKKDKNYVLELFYKSDLEAASTLRWDIIDASSGKILVSTKPIEKNADWTSITADFKTGEVTEAITIQLARESCLSTICPISGKVWFDDFSIK